MELQQQFEVAVANSKTLAEKPDNETLLKLYSLYKQATEGDCTEAEPTNPFDFVARAKHQAWAGLQGITASQAKEQYITLVTQLKAN